MCHFSCFYLLDEFQTSKGPIACEIEGRIIPMHIGRHERASPGKDLDLEIVS